MMLLRRATSIFVVLILATAGSAAAQNYFQNPRAFVRSPQVLATGDATVAMPSPETVFFYNPAHLSETTSATPRITIVGVQGAVSTSVFDQVSFFQDKVEPAIDRGFDDLSSEELDELYDKAFALGRQRAFASGDVILPSIQFASGPISIGAGFFAHTSANYRFEDAGLGVPQLDFVGRADAIGVVTGALDGTAIGFRGFSVGMTAKYTRRYISIKDRPLDAIGEDEPLHVFSGDAVTIDYGMLYRAGNLSLGLSVYDISSSDFDFAFDRTLFADAPAAPEINTRVQSELEAVKALNEIRPSYRIGAAYTAPRMLGVFGETTVMLDYLGYSDPVVNQSGLARLHLGAQSNIAGPLTVRGGLSQGYPSGGIGLHFGPLHIDYAFFGYEEGRTPGQTPAWNHLAQLRLAI